MALSVLRETLYIRLSFYLVRIRPQPLKWKLRHQYVKFIGVLVATVSTVAILAVSGCTNPEQKFLGIWSEQASAANPNLLKTLANSLTSTASLELRKDHKFFMKLPSFMFSVSSNTISFDGSVILEGTWAAEKEGVQLNTTLVAGKSLVEAAKMLALDSSVSLKAEPPVPDTPFASEPKSSSSTKQNLVVPSDATISDDDKRLMVHFKDGSRQPIELTKN